MPKKIILLLLIMFLILTIFIFSSQEGSESIAVSDSFTSNIIDRITDVTKKEITETRKRELVKETRFFVRKVAHFTLYFTLGLLVYLISINCNFKHPIIFSLIVCILLAGSDEIHQLFTDGRSARVIDVFIDTVGSGTAIVVTSLIRKLFLTRKFDKQPKL